MTQAYPPYRAYAFIDSIVAFNHNDAQHIRFNGIRIQLPTTLAEHNISSTAQITGIQDLLHYISKHYPLEDLTIGVDIGLISSTNTAKKLKVIESLFPLVDDIAVITSPSTAHARLKTVQSTFQQAKDQPDHYWLGLYLHDIPH